MNPILPVEHFVPDSETRQWKDGRVYLYGSYDIYGGTSFCSYEYHSFSSLDLINWDHHGCCFKSTGRDTDVPWSESLLFAPDCIYKDNLYYLYFCMADNSEGVATSEHPYGPFTNAQQVKGAHKDAIDPAIFIDDDGEAYLYWGQFNARGARLLPGMAAIDESTLNKSLLNEAEHGFHEGASMRKRNGIYYFVFADISRGKPTALGYATSTSPLGPFTKQNIIIDNIGCDKGTWNNHGSIAEINGKWYVFYHRSSNDSRYNRRVCIEPIYFNEDGTINEVEMTTQGVEGPIDATKWLEAYRACLLDGEVRTTQVQQTINDETSYYEYLSHITNGDWVSYKYLDFSRPVGIFEAVVASRSYGGEMVLRLDSMQGEIVGVCEVPPTNGWENWTKVSCLIKNQIEGVHALYIEFRGIDNRLFSLKEFRFV